MYPPAASVLRAHPVLLAKVLAEGLLRRYETGRKSLARVQKTLFLKSYDRAEKQRHRMQFLLAAQLILVTIKGAFGSEASGTPDDLAALQREALSGLRSWSDNWPMDEHFFQLCIRDTPEALYVDCDAESRPLRLAVARSPACCAYLAAHLFCKRVFRPLQKDEL